MEHRIYGSEEAEAGPWHSLGLYPAGYLAGLAQGGDRVLKEGDRAPNFTTVDHTGKEVSLADLRGKKVWLWFHSSPGGNN